MKQRLLAVLTFAAIVLASTGAWAAVYHFELQGLNTASDPSGNVIAITGQGTFNTTQGAVKGGGSFSVYASDGALLTKGTWVATDFGSFTPFGGVNNGFQAGQLEIDITLRPHGGAPITDVPMTVFCEPGEVPGPAEADSEDGTTVGEFTINAHGFTLFQLIRP